MIISNRFLALLTVPGIGEICFTASQKVVGYSHSIHATVVALNIFVKAIVIVAHEVHS